MGEGSRHDHLDDKIDHHNFRKNLALGDILARRLIIAKDECARQCANYEDLNSTLDPVVRSQWQAVVDEWRRDPTSPNPYALGGDQKNPTEAQVRASLTKEEAEEAARGDGPVYCTTAAACLALGLRIKGWQQKIIAKSSSPMLSLDAESKIHERRVAILAKLKPFRELQRNFMPGAATAMTAEEEACASDLPPPLAEHIRLWLPSDIPRSDRTAGLARGIAASEARLCEAQCTDALATLWRHLHSKQHLVAWRDANAVGQAVATRSRTLIDSVGVKVHVAAAKYRHARLALISLRGESSIPQFKPFLDSDLTSDIIVKDDALAQRKLAMVKGKSKRNHVSTSRQTVSWIWTFNVGPEDRHNLGESVRVKWSKSQLRVKQWSDEVTLLQEEMRRVLRFLVSMEKHWLAYAGEEIAVSSAESHGMCSYALKQAHVYVCI